MKKIKKLPLLLTIINIRRNSILFGTFRDFMTSYLLYDPIVVVIQVTWTFTTNEKLHSKFFTDKRRKSVHQQTPSCQRLTVLIFRQNREQNAVYMR